MNRILTVNIHPEDDGRMIREILRGKMGISHRLLTALKSREDGILLNGSCVFVTQRVKAGDALSLRLEEDGEHSRSIEATPGKLSVVYEDEDLLILDKPANLPVHPSKGHIRDSLANIVAWHYAQQGENFVFRCVNRLDSGTSGLMAVAKNAYAQDRLIFQMHGGGFVKEYLGIAAGLIPQDEGIIDRPVGRPPGVATIRREIRPDGDRAVTRFRVLSRSRNRTLLLLRTETGRTHQIRVHLASLGYPLVGDFLYGTEDRALITRHALHASLLGFRHPVTGKPLRFASSLPEDMAELLRNENGIP